MIRFRARLRNICLTITGVRAVRDNDEVDDQIDSLLNRTQDQLGLLEQRAYQLASMISGGQHDR